MNTFVMIMGSTTYVLLSDVGQASLNYVVNTIDVKRIWTSGLEPFYMVWVGLFSGTIYTYSCEK